MVTLLILSWFFLIDILGNNIKEGLTVISIIIGGSVGFLNIWFASKIVKSKEEMLSIFHSEVKRLESNMVTTKDIEALRREIGLMFQNIELKIKEK